MSRQIVVNAINHFSLKSFWILGFLYWHILPPPPQKKRPKQVLPKLVWLNLFNQKIAFHNCFFFISIGVLSERM